ncbi:MAG: uroporphyrinogen-III synthase, partial [Myxococcota bacterium]|nr:uroporphyrinogen-III synthase [Myxococcota bacterium]
FGLRPDLVAEEFVGEGLAQALIAKGPPRPVLLARALVARDALPEALRASGFDVEVVPVYETRSLAATAKERLEAALREGRADAAIFTSSSTVREVADALGPEAPAILSRISVASIGPITSKTLQSAGIRVDVAATEYTVPGVLDALSAYYAKGPISS